MKALFCTLVGDADRYLTDDGGDERRVEHVHNPSRDNTDRNMMDTMTWSCLCGDRLPLAVLTQPTVESVSWRTANALRCCSGSSEEFPVRLAEELVDCYHLNRLVRRLCSDVVTSL